MGTGDEITVVGTFDAAVPTLVEVQGVSAQHGREHSRLGTRKSGVPLQIISGWMTVRRTWW